MSLMIATMMFKAFSNLIVLIQLPSSTKNHQLPRSSTSYDKIRRMHVANYVFEDRIHHIHVGLSL